MGAASAPIFQSVRGPGPGPGSALRVAKWRCCCRQAGRGSAGFSFTTRGQTRRNLWPGLDWVARKWGLWPWIVLSPSGRVSRRLWPWPPSNAMIKGVLAKSLKRWRGVSFHPSEPLLLAGWLQRADFFFYVPEREEKNKCLCFLSMERRNRDPFLRNIYPFPFRGEKE